MGSVFLIVVPIRTHELKLRLIENDILTTLAVPVQPPEANNDNAILQTLKTAGEGGFKTEKGIPAKDIPLPTTKQDVMAYNMNKDGRQLLLQLTRDTMKLSCAGDDDDAKRDTLDSIDDVETASFQSLELLPKSGSLTSVDTDLGLIELIDSQFLEKNMEDILTDFSLLNAAWEASIDGKFSRVCFTVVESRADTVINRAHACKIGKQYESTLSVCATTVFSQEKPKDPKKSTAEAEIAEANEKSDKWTSFKESIKARLTVAQVVQNVKANSILTFDFIVMLIVAGIIATLGLLESSSVNLIASMLVSPLMGPIMAFTFGAMIRDVPLIKTGAYVELIGLLICLVVGFAFGICLEWQPFPGPWANVTRWPTSEMYSRGQAMSLMIGAAVAIPSGAGVALSILAGNAGSLVGVAISASLLPPCVNSGIFYGLALVIAIREISHGHDPFKMECNDFIGSENELYPGYTRKHETLYCSNALKEYAIMGTVSLCLTLLNIALIFVTGIIVLKIKEVAPYTTKSAFERFWKHDLKHARDYNKTHMGQDTLIHDLVDEPDLLDEIGEDYVFNQIKNRTMYREENVIDNVKGKTATGQAPTGGWIGALFSKSKPVVTDVEAKVSAKASAKANLRAQAQQDNRNIEKNRAMLAQNKAAPAKPAANKGNKPVGRAAMMNKRTSR